MSFKKKLSLRGKWISFQSISSYLFPHSIVYMLYLEYKNKSLLKTFSCLRFESLFLKKSSKYYIEKEYVELCLNKKDSSVIQFLTFLVFKILSCKMIDPAQKHTSQKGCGGSRMSSIWPHSLCNLSRVSVPQREGGGQVRPMQGLAFPTGKPPSHSGCCRLSLEPLQLTLKWLAQCQKNGGCWFSAAGFKRPTQTWDAART